MILPKKIFLTRGVGTHKENLTSFEMALRDAGIAQLNLVQVSSIFPPHCKHISRAEGLKYLSPGQVVFCVMSRNETNEPNRLVAASVGMAIPKNVNHYGYLSEHHSFGQSSKDAGDYAEDLAASMLATIIGVNFDPDASYDEKKEIWKISGEFVKTLNTTQTARGDKNRKWTTVVTAAVLIP